MTIETNANYSPRPALECFLTSPAVVLQVGSPTKQLLIVCTHFMDEDIKGQIRNLPKVAEQMRS